MSKDMLGSVIRAAVAVPQRRLDTLAKIASTMASDNTAGEAWHQRFCAVLREEVMPPTPTSLLELVYEVNLAAVTTFTAANKFRIGETVDGITVGWLGDNFKKHFRSKVEDRQIAAEWLTVNNLLKSSKDPAIITALGGEPKVEITLGQYWEFLKIADRSFWYVAYIRDDGNTLWAVGADWLGGGLSVGACFAGLSG